MKTYYVYILECSDKTFYTGFTSNLATRIISHPSGKHKDSYTYSRRPIKLAFYCEFTDPNVAIEKVKKLKNGREQKKLH